MSSTCVFLPVFLKCSTSVQPAANAQSGESSRPFPESAFRTIFSLYRSCEVTSSIDTLFLFCCHFFYKTFMALKPSVFIANMFFFHKNAINISKLMCTLPFNDTKHTTLIIIFFTVKL